MRRAMIFGVIAILVAGVSCIRAQEEPAPAAIEEAPPVDEALRNVLPADIYAVPGVEVNVYYDNIILHPNSELLMWDVDCNMGAQQNERWTCTPTEAQVGAHPLTIKIVSPEIELLHQVQTMVHVIDPAAGALVPLTMLCIGDSLTAASAYTGRLVTLFAEDASIDMTLIGEYGPRGDSGNQHEGYPGWAADTFVNRWDPVGEWKEIDGRNRRVRSPFLFDVDGEPQLDFQQYLDKNNGGNTPDFITILLGCNDTFHGTEETIEEKIDAFLGNMDKLLAEFARVAPDTEIGVLYLVPPSRYQDSFGANYTCSQTRWQYRRNVHRVVEREMETYLGREDENIFMVPAFVNVDSIYGFGGAMVAPNAHSSDKIRRMTNGVHPTTAGYYQIGDAIYCWAKSRLAAE